MATKSAAMKNSAKEKSLDELRYPIGKFVMPQVFSEKEISAWIKTIEKFPMHLKEETGNLTNKKLKWKYRPDSWCIRQVVHHCADSHSNALTRFKLALTENNPTVKPYLESLWAELPDSNAEPVDSSLKIVSGVHHRLVVVLKSMSVNDFERTYFHPESNRIWKLYEVLALYAWHCNHHFAHIKQAKKYKGKFE